MSVRSSVCPVERQRRPAGLLPSALRAGDIDRQLRAPTEKAQRRLQLGLRRRETELSTGQVGELVVRRSRQRRVAVASRRFSYVRVACLQDAGV